MTSSSSISQKEYLKKYLSGDTKKKKKKKITGANFKRSVIVDDDIDLNSMRPLENDEVELYQMDEDAPQIAGIVDERPAEVKAQEYYSSKRWKVFGGEDGVNVVDSINKDEQSNDKVSKALKSIRNSFTGGGNSYEVNQFDKKNGSKFSQKKSEENSKDTKNDRGIYSPHQNKHDRESSKIDQKRLHNSSNYKPVKSVTQTEGSKYSYKTDDSDVSPPRKHQRSSSSESDDSLTRRKYSKDSDQSPPRRDSGQISQTKSSSKYDERFQRKSRSRSYSKTPPKRNKTIKHKYKSDSDDSSPRRQKPKHFDSDNSSRRKRDYKTQCKYSPDRKEKKSQMHEKFDSDASPPRRSDKYPNVKSHPKSRSFSDSDNSPPRRERIKSLNHKMRRLSRSRSPSQKIRKSFRSTSPKHSRTSDIRKKNRRDDSESEDSLLRRKNTSKGSDSDMSPPRNNSVVNDRPRKKVLYKPNDDSSSDEGTSKSKNKKMETTLDGKQAGLQDAKQLKKELSDLRMKEDTMFAKMDASISGVGAAPVKRDRKTGQIRDLEKEKEAQKEKEAKESVVNEKYYKWGKGIKQTEDAAARAAEAIKEMNKPLARYVDDKDLDEFLKAQDREGDPMLDYIKRKQSESTPLQGVNPIYKGSWNPNRFNIRPGYRWDGVVRSNGYEQEWFKTKNAKKARDEEAYKWSTSDM